MIYKHSHCIRNNVLSEKGCNKIISIGVDKMHRIGMDQTQAVVGDHAVSEDIRVSQTVFLDAGEIGPVYDLMWSYANWVRDHYFPMELSWVQTAQFTRYDSSERAFYNWHRDGGLDIYEEYDQNNMYDRRMGAVFDGNVPVVDKYTDSEGKTVSNVRIKHNWTNYPDWRHKTRKLSVSVLLSDQHSGGDLQFMMHPKEVQEGSYIRTKQSEYTDRTSNKITVDMKRGDAVFFPSYQYHRVTPVTDKVRFSLVFWFLGAPWF